jgi:hypothetical protein
VPVRVRVVVTVLPALGALVVIAALTVRVAGAAPFLTGDRGRPR